MPKDLQYGPQPYVSDSNPDWEERQELSDELMTPAATQNSRPPKAYPIDLHHLSKQAFLNDIEAKKRWFLTAFVAPEDQHLLAPTANPEPVIGALEAIKQALDAPAAECSEATLQALRDQIVALFKLEKWLGVALAIVDSKELSIDMLNTLIQWQAFYIQFGEKFFSLVKISAPLTQNTVHHIVSAQTGLTLEQIRDTDWGKKIEAYRSPYWKRYNADAEPTLYDFYLSFVSHHRHLVADQKILYLEAPSTVRVEHDLINQLKPSHIMPLYSFGFLAFEDFCAAAFVGSRPMQAYLPGAKGNLYWAHGSYYGEALMVHHDYIHAEQYNFDKENFEKIMKLLAITANAMVRIGQIKLANDLIDLMFFGALDFHLIALYNKYLTPEALFNRRTLTLTSIYHEIALASGITLSFSCTQDSQNKDLFHMGAMHQEHPLSLTVDLSIEPINDQSKYLKDFMRAFEEISTLSTIQTQQQQDTGDSTFDIPLAPATLINYNVENHNNAQPKSGCFMLYRSNSQQSIEAARDDISAQPNKKGACVAGMLQ